MSFMVVDLTDPPGLDDRPFGKWGPYEAKWEADEFVRLHPHPESLMVLPTEMCR